MNQQANQNHVYYLVDMIFLGIDSTGLCFDAIDWVVDHFGNRGEDWDRTRWKRDGDGNIVVKFAFRHQWQQTTVALLYGGTLSNITCNECFGCDSDWRVILNPYSEIS